MKIRKLTATAMLSIAAVGITSGVAAGDPPAVPDAAVSAWPVLAQGVERGVGYTIDRDDTTLTATLADGTFGLTADAITVTAADGTQVASLPLRTPVEEQLLELAPRLDADGTRLIAEVSARQMSAEEIGYWHKTSPRQRSIEAGMSIGAALGGIAGVFLGMVIGIATSGLLIPITLPVGLIGGVLGGIALGGAAGAAIPNSDIPDQWEYELECRGSGDYRFCW
ncbi:hypothetical protein ACL02S_09385 [Nocardia sp. 004]|uniref:hypothetical protein n=1 Tax=Nocardia sp. 004 TaxID=3385978 RepID=UPI0039A0AFD9